MNTGNNRQAFFSDREKVGLVFSRLRCANYASTLFVGQNAEQAQSLVHGWDMEGFVGYIYGTSDQESCFNCQGKLVKPLTLYWSGDGPGLIQSFKNVSLHALYRGNGTSSLLLTSGPEIVTLCGSTRFSEDFYWENRALTYDGLAVYSIGCDFKSDEALGLAPEIKQAADFLHWWKVMDSRVVYVLNRGDYIGESTGAEIRLARALNKDIWWIEPHHCVTDCRCRTGPVPVLSGERPPVVYLTAPFDLLTQLRDYNLQETLAGRMVLTCGEEELARATPQYQTRQLALRRWKIAHAQHIIAIVDENGYDGPTLHDIACAKELHIPLRQVRL